MTEIALLVVLAVIAAMIPFLMDLIFALLLWIAKEIRGLIS